MKAPSLIQSPAIRGVKYLAGYSKIYLKMNFKRETTLLCPLFRVAVYAEDWGTWHHTLKVSERLCHVMVFLFFVFTVIHEMIRYVMVEQVAFKMRHEFKCLQWVHYHCNCYCLLRGCCTVTCMYIYGWMNLCSGAYWAKCCLWGVWPICTYTYILVYFLHGYIQMPAGIKYQVFSLLCHLEGILIYGTYCDIHFCLLTGCFDEREYSHTTHQPCFIAC